MRLQLGKPLTQMRPPVLNASLPTKVWSDLWRHLMAPLELNLLDQMRAVISAATVTP